MTDHVLRIDCPDEKGLVYRVTGALFHAGYNIISNQEFVDSATANFFMRTTFAGPGTPERVASDLQRVLPAAATVRLTTTAPRCSWCWRRRSPTASAICCCVTPTANCRRRSARW